MLYADPTLPSASTPLPAHYCNTLRYMLATDNGDACAVCGDEEALENNAIVFCDGCGLALHQECAHMPPPPPPPMLLLLLLLLMPWQMRQHSGCPRS
jgi:hypothetical protein